MNKRRVWGFLFFCGLLVVMATAWILLQLIFPRADSRALTASEKMELQRVGQELETLRTLVTSLELTQSELRTRVDDLNQQVVERSLSVPIKAGELTRFQDLSAQVRYFHNRIEKDLSRMRNVESTLRNVAAQIPEGRLYAVQVEEYQRQVELKLTHFEQASREFSSGFNERMEQWNMTLQFLAAILAIFAAIVTALAGTVLLMNQGANNP